MERHKIAEGNTSEIFEISEGKVLKLFKAGYPKSTAYHEYSNHNKVSRVMSNIPRLFEFIEEDLRFGFIMEKVEGKSLASLMINENTFDHAMDLFSDLHKKWLMQTMDDIIPYTEWMLSFLKGRSFRDNLLEEKIQHLPTGNVLCHGDFHPYNIIFSSENNSAVIDFANVCKAPKEYDVARTYFLLQEAVPEKAVAEFYLKKMQVEHRDIDIYIEVIRNVRRHEIYS